jgi:Mlc titration factor MtfA (ptsG expression regulator)
VASDAFFEKPRQLRSKHPELYDELRKFYQVDPLEWV